MGVQQESSGAALLLACVAYVCRVTRAAAHSGLIQGLPPPPPVVLPIACHSCCSGRLCCSHESHTRHLCCRQTWRYAACGRPCLCRPVACLEARCRVVSLLSLLACVLVLFWCCFGVFYFLPTCCSQRTPLIYAAAGNHIHACEALIAARADVNARDDECRPPAVKRLNHSDNHVLFPQR